MSEPKLQPKDIFNLSKERVALKATLFKCWLMASSVTWCEVDEESDTLFIYMAADLNLIGQDFVLMRAPLLMVDNGALTDDLPEVIKEVCNSMTPEKFWANVNGAINNNLCDLVDKLYKSGKDEDFQGVLH